MNGIARSLWSALASVATLLFSSAALAQIETVPADLSPGDRYRLVFVTSAGQPATSTDIATYNQFVTNVANGRPELSALGTTWSVIGSTATVDARDNTGTNPAGSVGVPIYLLDGATRIANDNADLWDGAIAAAISIAEDGSTPGNTLTATGTQPDGTVVVSRELGSTNPPIGPLARVGRNDSADSNWVEFANSGVDNENQLYAISGVLRVSADGGPAAASPLPVPAATVPSLLMTILLGLLFAWRRLS